MIIALAREYEIRLTAINKKIPSLRMVFFCLYDIFWSAFDVAFDIVNGSIDNATD